MMADNQNHQPNIELARDLLSPYMDGEVTEEERGLVEEALAASGELQQDLAILRQTVSFLADLPQVPAPRPFTLSEADVRGVAPKPSRRFFGLPAWVGGVAAAAASLLCVLAVGGVLLMQQGGSLSAPAEIALYDENVASQAAVSEAESAEAMEAPAAEADIAMEQAVEEEVAAPAEAPAPAVEEKLMAAEEPAPEEAAPAPPVAAKEESMAVEAEEMAADEAAEDMVSVAGESAAAEAESRAGADSSLATGDEADAVAGSVLAETPSPMPTMAALVAPPATPPLAEKAQPAEVPALEGESAAGLAESSPALPPAPAEAQEENLATTTVEQQPAAASTLLPTPTVMAKLTFVPSPEPTLTTLEAGLQSKPPAQTTVMVIAGIIIVFGALVVIGIILWLLFRKRQN